MRSERGYRIHPPRESEIDWNIKSLQAKRLAL